MFQIALDGPAGSGKSTVGKMLAKKLNFIFVDTGAMYRAFTYKVLKDNIDYTNNQNIIDMFKTINIVLNEQNEVFLNNKNITAFIRTPQISELTSKLSTIEIVRNYLVKIQQALANNYNVVMDGRDIGTVVLPNANLKIFLVASVGVRIKRRKLELQQNNVNLSDEQILKEIAERDARDENRKVSPLKKADDAITIVSDNYNIEEIVNMIINLAKQKGLKVCQ